MRILIVKLSAIGDVIHTLPALNALRRHYPGAHITWVVEEAAASLIQGHRALDRVLISRRKTWINRLRKGPGRRETIQEIVQFFRALRGEEYDRIIDFQQLLKSGILVGLSRGKRKIGFGRGMAHMEESWIFLNERIPPVDMEIHALTRNLLLLEAIGIPRGPVTYDLPILESDRKRVPELLGNDGLPPSGFAAINPVAKWKTKLWDEARFAETADILSEKYGLLPVFTGSSQDRETVAGILGRMKKKAVDLSGKTSLTTLAAVYERAEFLLTTDTGPMHLGAAVGIPVVALFGPTAPWRTGPFGNGHQVVRMETPCSPCFKRDCPTRECMMEISVNRVLAAIEQIYPGRD